MGSNALNTIQRSSLDHASGFLNSTGERYSGCSGDASATFFTKTSCGPSRSLAKTTRVLLGDQTGESFQPRPDESGTAPPRARSTSHSDASVIEFERTNTACVPSGEMRNPEYWPGGTFTVLAVLPVGSIHVAVVFVYVGGDENYASDPEGETEVDGPAENLVDPRLLVGLSPSDTASPVTRRARASIVVTGVASPPLADTR